MRGRYLRLRDRSPSPKLGVKNPTTPHKDASHPQTTNHHESSDQPLTPLGPYPLPPDFYALPPNRGFVDRYPRVGEFRSLNAILGQIFPDNEREAEKNGASNDQRPAGKGLLLGGRRGQSHEVAQEQKVPQSPPTPVRDDSYRVTCPAEVPVHYPFRNKDRKGKAQEQNVPQFPLTPIRDDWYHVTYPAEVHVHYPFRNKDRTEGVAVHKFLNDDSSGEPSNTRYQREGSLERVPITEKNGDSFSDLQQASRSSPTPMSPKHGSTEPPNPWQGLSNLAGQSESSWSELTELIGPLPWPLLNVKTDAFSTEPEFRVFLEPELDEAREDC